MTRILAILAAIMFPAGAVQARADSGKLGEKQYIADGITPGIATDAAGVLHLVYMEGSTIWHRTTDPAGRLTQPRRVPSPSDSGIYNSPHLVCDPSGAVHLVFTREFTGRAKTVWYTNWQDGRWRAPVAAIDHSETNRRTNYPRVTVDRANAYVTAFTGDGSTVAKLVDVFTAPRVVNTRDTPLWVAHPFVRNSEVVLVGRGGGLGHMLQRHSLDLEPLAPTLLLSRGTPKKTGEPTAACLDRAGVIHAAGVTGGAPELIWYANDVRASDGASAVLGPVVGDHVDEYTYPVLQADVRGQIYLAYRHHATGEGKVTVIDPATGQFSEPVNVAPAVMRRLRWNIPLAPAAGSGVHAVWESEGRIYLRTVGESPRD